jgi:hypothetical protein
MEDRRLDLDAEIVDRVLAGADIFAHVRLVMGFVISLSIARLLTGVSRFVQHPDTIKIYSVHLIWTVSVLLMLIHFWWWEFRLTGLPQWNFAIYTFLVGFAIVLFLLCSLLYPDNIAEYSGFEEYFYSRRAWFFGLFALTFVFDFVDTALKGKEHLESFGTEYWVRAPVYVALSGVAMWTRNKAYHWTFAVANLVYQVSFVTRLFMTLD